MSHRGLPLLLGGGKTLTLGQLIEQGKFTRMDSGRVFYVDGFAVMPRAWAWRRQLKRWRELDWFFLLLEHVASDQPMLQEIDKVLFPERY